MDYYIYKIEELERQAKAEIDNFINTLSKDREKIIFLNIETTGIDVYEILKITIMNGNKKILFDKLIKPSYAKSWPAAERANHITPDMVKDEKTFYHYKKTIKRIIENADAVICWYPDFVLNGFSYKKQQYEIKNIIDLQEMYSILRHQLFILHDYQSPLDESYTDFEKCYTYKKESLNNCCNSIGITTDNKIEKIYQCYQFIDENIRKNYMEK